MSQKYGKLIIKDTDYKYSVKLNSADEQHWLETQRPLIENVVAFFNDRQFSADLKSVDILSEYHKQNVDVLNSQTFSNSSYAELF